VKSTLDTFIESLTKINPALVFDSGVGYSLEEVSVIHYLIPAFVSAAQKNRKF
jgi:hypothetical protein